MLRSNDFQNFKNTQNLKEEYVTINEREKRYNRAKQKDDRLKKNERDSSSVVSKEREKNNQNAYSLN